MLQDAMLRCMYVSQYYLRNDPEAHWPFGDRWVAHYELGHHLRNVGQWQARLAIEKFSSDEEYSRLLSAMAAGSAVEYLTKALLADIEPTLLAEKADPATLLHLAGKSSRAATPVTYTRTISVSDAMSRAKGFFPKSALPKLIPSNSVHPALAVRNAATHLAIVDQLELNGSVIAMARWVDAVLGVFDPSIEREEFWGADLIVGVDALLDGARTREEREYQSKLAAALFRFNQLKERYSPDDLPAVFAAMSSVVHREYQVSRDCPACGQIGLLGCEVEHGHTDYEQIDEDDFDVTVHEPVATPIDFWCPICSLKLNAADLVFAQLDHWFEIAQDDPDYEYYQTGHYQSEQPEPDF